MPIIKKVTSGGYETTVAGVHLLTEDPRPGHNVMYLGQGYDAHDAITLKPLWGLAGTFVPSTTSSSYGGSSLTNASNGHNHEQNSLTYMMLAGKHPCGYGGLVKTAAINNASYSQLNGTHLLTLNMDSENRREFHQIKDNGDGTSTIMITNQSMGNCGHEGYSVKVDYVNLPDDQELYEASPSYWATHTTTTVLRGCQMGYSALDGTNSGFAVLSNVITTYPTYPNMTMMTPGGLYSVENSYGSTGSGSGYYMQFCGMSRVDGRPIFIERRHSNYTPHFVVCKYTGSSWTTLLSEYNTSAGYASFASVSTSYTYNNSLGTGAGVKDHNTGTTDSYARFGSTWFRENDTTSKYLYSIHPQPYGGAFFADVIRWDTTTDTFVGAGMQGPSTLYATLYHRTASGGNAGYTTINQWGKHPMESTTLATSSGHSGTQQALSHAMVCDVHGYTDATGATETAWDPTGMTGDIVAFSDFNVTRDNGAYDSDDIYRRLRCWTTYRYSTTDYYYYCYMRSTTVIPETPIDYVWCDSGKTVLGVICLNATYLYQCRKGSAISHGNTAGANFKEDTSTATSTFNVEPATNQMGWVHTATIPHHVYQMGIDKYDRLWYVTYDVPGPYYATSSTNTERYHKQMWMITSATPHKVNLTGNATTDTITYSGSNIDKTLTIEALNFKGQRLAKTITLTISNTSAQFDNGSQTKDVTTSSSGTVDETITVTAAGSFNITAAFGA